MGLDMYLQMRVSYYKYDSECNRQKLPDLQLPAVLKDFKNDLDYIAFELAYWRKHPNLHGFIVENFADGKDECQEIYIGEQGIGIILDAIKSKELPHTEGFFFGASDDSDEAVLDDVATFEKIKDKVRQINKHDGYHVDIYYNASW